MIYTIKALSFDLESTIKAIEVDEDFIKTPEGSSILHLIDAFDIKKKIVVDTKDLYEICKKILDNIQ